VIISRSGIVTAALAALVVALGWIAIGRATDAVSDASEVRPRGPLEVGGEPFTVKVASGANGASIARQMEQNGIITEAGLFSTLAGLMGVQNELAAGEYEFSRGMPVVEAIQRLRLGVTVPSLTVTIPEGRRIEEVAALMERQGLVSAADFMAAAAATDYPQSLAQTRPPGSSLEGYLFPDTYFFSKKATAHDIVERLLSTLEERFSPELRRAAEAQNLTPHQALTLASIVEREAQVAEERPLIAAAFLNRLKAGIPLQADPTVQFALTVDPASVEKYGWWKRDLTVEDLKIESAYNSYQNQGLPPGPIANPGLDVIKAIANPAPVKYLYFVAKGDGSHAFAETLADHNRNVQRYQP
jgi:UPF0755 protein